MPDTKLQPPTNAMKHYDIMTLISLVSKGSACERHKSQFVFKYHFYLLHNKFKNLKN